MKMLKRQMLDKKASRLKDNELADWADPIMWGSGLKYTTRPILLDPRPGHVWSLLPLVCTIVDLYLILNCRPTLVFADYSDPVF